jgi:hypothetical protein
MPLVRRHQHAHRIPRPTLVTIAQRPLWVRDAQTRTTDLPDGTRGSFATQEVTAPIALVRLPKSVFSRYLAPAHPALHAADVLLYSATQAPDNPQFMAQENPFVSQREMHSAAV